MKQTNLEALNVHLFETIEALKCNNDPSASANEKIDLETAKQITAIGKVIVEGFKVRANVLGIISNRDNQNLDTQRNVKEIAEIWGITQ